MTDMRTIQSHLHLALLLAIVGIAPLARAEQQPLWEAGAGVGLLSMPDYLGSDRHKTYALPIPYLVYRGEVLQVDRDKVRGLFYKNERSEWDVSLGAAVPVKSRDNTARSGMPNLDPTVEVGPQWSYRLRDDWLKATLRLPVRKVLAVDGFKLHDAGTVFTPTLALDRDDHPAPGWHASISTGPQFGDRNYHRYYYEVTPAQATPSRPTYTAAGGYGGWQFTTTLSKRFDSIWLGGFLRGNWLAGAAFEDSPLVREKFSWMGGVGMAWVFAESNKKLEVGRPKSD